MITKMMELGNYKVDIQHTFNKEGRNVTIATVFDKENRLLSKGRTIISLKDRFNKSLGRKKAMSKAINKDIIPDKEERRQIWESYRTLTKNPRW